MRAPEDKVVPFARLRALAERLRAEGRKIVTTNGCFDLLHWGHISYLAGARALGDVLIVGVNADASVRRLKGETRPLHDERTRALQLAGLESVDYVVVFGESEPSRFLREVRPAVHAKGADYAGKTIPEQAVMAELGGELAFVPLVEGLSTTAIAEKLRASELLADE